MGTKKQWPTKRFVLLHMVEFGDAWMIYDRLRYRVSDGVYMTRSVAEEQCAYQNAYPAEGDRDWYEEERSIWERRTWAEWLKHHNG